MSLAIVFVNAFHTYIILGGYVIHPPSGVYFHVGSPGPALQRAGIQPSLAWRLRAALVATRLSSPSRSLSVRGGREQLKRQLMKLAHCSFVVGGPYLPLK